MNTTRNLTIALALSLSLLACGGQQPAPTQPNARQPETFIGKAVKEVTDEAREEMQNGNIDISVDEGGLPKAEITPKGDLLIGGQAVAIDATQRALLLEHRAAIMKIVSAAIDVGMQGADLAGKAVTEAIAGIFSGDQQTLEQRMEKKLEAEAQNIEASAKKICVHLLPLLTSQQKLAAAIPEFRPYAKMTQKDVDECNTEAAGIKHNIETNGKHAMTDQDREDIRNEIRSEVRNGVREAIRGTVREAVGADKGTTQDTAAEAEAASIEASNPQATGK